jgi:hypothetical protein
MSVAGYEVEYGRHLGGSKLAPAPVSSTATITMYVTGAFLEPHHRPVDRVFVQFSNDPPDPSAVGHVNLQPPPAIVTIFLPWADFAGMWAALRLDRVPTLELTVDNATVKVVSVRVKSQGDLPFFGGGV